MLLKLCQKKKIKKNKTTEVTGKLIGNKIADKIVKPNPVPDP